MTPETKLEMFRRALLALALTAIVSPVLGVWAIAAWVEKIILKVKHGRGK